jgi:hypothetical protein
MHNSPITIIAGYSSMQCLFVNMESREGLLSNCIKGSLTIRNNPLLNYTTSIPIEEFHVPVQAV